MHSLAGSSTSRTFLGFTAAFGTFLPPQQGAAKPISPPPPPPPEKHKTSSYALHRARVPMKTYHFINLALRRCLVPLQSETLAPLGSNNSTLRFYSILSVIHLPRTQIIHCPCMRQIRIHRLQKPYYACSNSKPLLQFFQNLKVGKWQAIKHVINE